MAPKEKKQKKPKKEKTRKEKPVKRKNKGELDDQSSAEISVDKKSKGGGLVFGIISLLSALLIICVVLFGFLFIIIKINFMGVADTYKESVAGVPLLNLALPVEAEEGELTFEDVMKENTKLKKDVEDLKSKEEYALSELERLRTFEDEYQARIMVNEERTRDLEKQIADLEAEKRAMEEVRYEVERMIAEGDTEGFAQYFEMVQPSIAAEIYAQIIQKSNTSDETKSFIRLYEGIDPATTAAIFEEMGLTRLDLIVDVLNGMKREVATEVISAMNTEFASAVTLRLAAPFY